MWHWVPLCQIHPCALLEREGRLEMGFMGCRVLEGGSGSWAKATDPSLPTETAEPPSPVPLAVPSQPGQHRLPLGYCEYLWRGSQQ